MKKQKKLNKNIKFLENRIFFLNLAQYTALLIIITMFGTLFYSKFNNLNDITLNHSMYVFMGLFLIQSLSIYTINKIDENISNKNICLPKFYKYSSFFMLIFSYLTSIVNTEFIVACFFLFITVLETYYISLSDFIHYKKTLTSNIKKSDSIVNHFNKYLSNHNETEETNILREKKDLYINEKINIIKQKYGENWFLMNHDDFNSFNTKKLESLKNNYIKKYKKLEFKKIKKTSLI